jgi:hypothetical protein
LLLHVLGAHNVDADVLVSGEGVAEDDKMLLIMSLFGLLCSDALFFP